MRNITLFILGSLILASCADKRFDDIDFLAYAYRQSVSDSPEFELEVKIICPFYLHIDNKYNCQLIRGRTYEDTSTYFIEVKKDPKLRELIDEIINKSKNYDTETDLRPNRLAFNDGSNFKIRIVKGGKSKVIHFWQDQETGIAFEKLYYYSKDLFNQGHYIPIDYLTQKRKKEFVNFVIKSDSILRPIPPNVPKDFKPKYVPPKVIN
jgi:hypothetical protein